jgi:hypothetical protein
LKWLQPVVPSKVGASTRLTVKANHLRKGQEHLEHVKKVVLPWQKAASSKPLE